MNPFRAHEHTEELKLNETKPLPPPKQQEQHIPTLETQEVEQPNEIPGLIVCRSHPFTIKGNINNNPVEANSIDDEGTSDFYDSRDIAFVKEYSQVLSASFLPLNDVVVPDNISRGLGCVVSI